MENICKSCGAPYEEGTRFCANCGASIEGNKAAPKATNTAETIKKISKFILIFLLITSLAFAVLNFGGFYKVKATITSGDNSMTQSGKVSDLYEQSIFKILAIGNFSCAILMVVTSAIAVLGMLKEFGVSAISDKLFKGKKNCKELCKVGFWGTIAMGVNVFCYLLTGMNDLGENYRFAVSAPWYAWIALVLFAAVIVIDKVVINKKK